MQKMSTGQEATLGEYRKNTVALFGEDSPAVKFLDKKIAAQGEGAEVIAAESQMLMVLADLHFGKSKDSAE